MEYDRLTGLDASFLHLESEAQPMHVGSLATFEGPPFFDDSGRFRLEDAREIISSRLHLVPRFRKKVMTVPLGQGRPIWVDDHDFDLNYHVRLTALPKPGNEEQLKTLMGRLQSTVLDRRRPLWELWFVEGLEGDRVAIIQKTHHALVDGISGVDVATVLLDLEPNPEPVKAPTWMPKRPPSSTQLLRDSIVERATVPAEMVRSARAAVRGPRRMATRLTKTVQTLATMGSLAPRTPLNVAVGPHRRVEFVRADLGPVKDVKRTHGATVNDVVLAAVAGGLRHFLEARGEKVDGVVLRAFVPVSVRDDSERMALGNKVSGLMVSLPVGEPEPLDRLKAISAQTAHLKETQQAVGAEVLAGLADYAPAPKCRSTAWVPACSKRFPTSAPSRGRRSSSPCFPMTARSASASPVTATPCPTSVSSPRASRSPSRNWRTPRSEGRSQRARLARSSKLVTWSAGGIAVSIAAPKS
jgi:WS/DGAT/MGAT family acyltransferase